MTHFETPIIDDDILEHTHEINSFEASRDRIAHVLAGDTLHEDGLEALRIELFRRRSEDLQGLSAVQQAERLNARAVTVLPYEDLVDRLTRSKQSSVPLNIKYGIDPTGAEVHLGHAVPMLMLSRMQRMGHSIQFIIGDMTAKIGDPSGRVSARPVLTDEQIAKNLETYQAQVTPLFDMTKVTLHHNNDWLYNFPLGEFLQISAHINAAQVLQRKDFQDRLDNGLRQSEQLYPSVMAIDSVKVQADIELGGRDQLLNMQMGRTVMKAVGMPEQVVMATDIIEGTDGTGAKMSKSLGNYVGLAHTPDEIFGRIMSIPDTLMKQYFTMLTEIEDSEWDRISDLMIHKGVRPIDIKKLLAFDLVHVLHSQESAEAAVRDFETKYTKRSYDELENLPTLSLSAEEPMIDKVTAAVSTARGKAYSRKTLDQHMKDGGVRAIGPNGEVKIANRNDLEIQILNAKHIKIGRTVILIVK